MIPRLIISTIYLIAFSYYQIYAQSNHHELIVCGWNEVFILDMSDSQNGQPRKVWSWQAKDRLELPTEMRAKFNSTDECKPLNGGTQILITSSGGGVALVERATGVVVFYAYVPNAHSADMLPNNKIAVAASRHEEGNRLLIYDLEKSAEVLISEPLESGHGIVWDQQRQLLWALGYNQLKAYQLVDWDTSEPSLLLSNTYNLPENGGHDLYPVPESAEMTITTSNHCWVFNRDSGSFNLHPLLSDMQAVKAISINPINQQLVYIKADTSWWSENLRFLNPNNSIYYKNEHFYKARWNVTN